MPKAPIKKTKTRSSEPETTEKSFDVTTHVLVPKHEVCTAEEKKSIIDRYGVEPNQLPRINPLDPAIRHLGVKQGDLIRITRVSPTAGDATFYRIVASE